MSKKPKKNQKTNTNTGTKSTIVTSSAQSIPSKTNLVSNEDYELLELAKMVVKDGDDNLQTLINKLAEEENKKHKEKLEKEEEEFKKNLNLKYDEKQKEINNLKKEIENLETQKSSLEDIQTELAIERKNIEIERQKILNKAEQDARIKKEQIYKEEIQQFKKDQKELEGKLKDVGDKEKQLEDEKSDFEDEKELTRIAFEKRDNKLKIKEEEYNKANPERLSELESQIDSLKGSIERWQTEYKKIQSEKTQLELTKAKSEGFTIEELQQERERLETELNAMYEKYNSYDDLKLKEMNVAFEERPRLFERITQLESEVANKSLELNRRENVQLEYEQLKEQLTLLRALNDHLREELLNTRKMLESSTGDVCPALTQIDVNAESEQEINKERERKSLKSLNESLYSIVKHVIQYAASQEKPLFYSESDIKAFIAGLAASPFSILQGMSGTGKTSLPRVFAAAICGEVNIIPVKSSWRDSNELLGYYNDFSKKFTAKEFTCALYKSNTRPYETVPYFIVLDEMNLSRVEYYFADFLSVLENDSKDWKVQLVETDMRQLPNEITQEVRDALEADDSERIRELRSIAKKLYPEGESLDADVIQNLQAGEKQKLLHYLEEKHFKNALGTAYLVTGPQLLIEGKIIPIPENIWFIGTANKDESTFEITDKVYDRAQVINFRDRAEGTAINNPINAKFIPYDVIKKLFLKAQNEYPFDGANDSRIRQIDDYLKEHFAISFGNRILDQVNKFVPTFLAASSLTVLTKSEKERYINEALDYQITNKVLRKLEYVDMEDKELSELGVIFDQYNMKKAKRFIESKKPKKA